MAGTSTPVFGTHIGRFVVLGAVEQRMGFPKSIRVTDVSVDIERSGISEFPARIKYKFSSRSPNNLQWKLNTRLYYHVLWLRQNIWKFRESEVLIIPRLVGASQRSILIEHRCWGVARICKKNIDGGVVVVGCFGRGYCGPGFANRAIDFYLRHRQIRSRAHLHALLHGSSQITSCRGTAGKLFDLFPKPFNLFRSVAGLDIGGHSEAMCISSTLPNFLQRSRANPGLPVDSPSSQTGNCDTKNRQNHHPTFKNSHWLAFSLLYICMGIVGISLGVYFGYVQRNSLFGLGGLFTTAFGFAIFVHGVIMLFGYTLKQRPVL